MAEKQFTEDTFLADQFRLSGRHAYEARQLTSIQIDPPYKTTIFNRNIDVVKSAPLVGFLYHRLADVDRTKDPDSGIVYDYSVMDKQMIDAHQELMYNFRIIMLLDSDYEPDEKKRVDKGLRHFAEDPADQERFLQYLRGGIDVLHEKLMAGNSKTVNDYLTNIFEFITDFKERYNDSIECEAILDKLRK